MPSTLYAPWLALRVGLGFPMGPVELLAAGGMVEHFETSKALHEALGGPEFFPARRARVEALRAEAGLRENQA